MSAGVAVAPDAAMALGIAATAMPFARTREDEAERWLRVLRLHGTVGIALQSLGVSEMPLAERTEPAAKTRSGRDAVAGAGERDTVARVTEHAIRIAGEREASTLATADLLMAVMFVYGDDFDRVLRVHGTDREEVLERLRSSDS